MNNLNQNKKTAADFYLTAFFGNPGKAVELYVGEIYIQHNPGVKNGIQGFIEYFERMNREYPNKSMEILRSVAENDLVAVHTHQIWPEEEYITMDFFRFDENGKIIEHWDSVQKVPEMAENKMF